MEQKNKAIIDTTLELVEIDSRNRPHGEDEISSYISDFLEKIKITSNKKLTDRGYKISLKTPFK